MKRISHKIYASYHLIMIIGNLKSGENASASLNLARVTRRRRRISAEATTVR